MPQIKGTGDAEQYWEEYRRHLSDDQIQFSMVRVVMGDAESRRPKFVFITWLGKATGVMARSRGGMHKADLKKVIGQFHLELATDAKDEIDLLAVKKTIKKGMGADYDMGSNSRSASGKEGNQDTTIAHVKYATQQSAIKAHAAAAYQGGDTVKIAGNIGSGSVSPASAAAVVTTVSASHSGTTLSFGVCGGGGAAVVARYKCVKKSQIRAGFDMTSDKAGVMDIGTVVEATERRENEKGILRVQLKQGGWVSEHAGNGAVCLELLEQISPAPADISTRGYCCVKKSQIRAGFEMSSAKAGVMGVGTTILVLASRRNEAGILRLQFEGGWVSEHSSNGAVCLERVPAADQSKPHPAPAWAAAAPAAAASESVVATFLCVKKSQIRAGFAMDSEKAGILSVGTLIEALDEKTNEQHANRV